MAGKADQLADDPTEMQRTAADLAEENLQRLRDAANLQKSLQLDQIQLIAKSLDPALLDKLLRIAQILAEK